MLNIVNKLFGSGSKKIIKSYSKIVKQINDHEPSFANFSDDELFDLVYTIEELVGDFLPDVKIKEVNFYK